MRGRVRLRLIDRTLERRGRRGQTARAVVRHRRRDRAGDSRERADPNRWGRIQAGRAGRRAAVARLRRVAEVARAAITRDAARAAGALTEWDARHTPVW